MKAFRAIIQFQSSLALKAGKLPSKYTKTKSPLSKKTNLAMEKPIFSFDKEKIGF